MKAGIHPDYHIVKVVMTDGSSFETRSTYGKEGEVLQLDVDPKTHPAWTGNGGYINENASQVARFNKRFGNLKLKSAGNQAAAADNQNKAAEEKKASKKKEDKKGGE